MNKGYRVYVEEERCRTFQYLVRAEKYAEKRQLELCNKKGIGYQPQVSICSGSGSNFKEHRLTPFGWK